MDIKQILLVLAAEASGEGAIETAARLARQFGATVDGVCLYQEPEPQVAECFAEGPEAISQVLDRRLVQVKTLTAPAELAFRRRLEGPGLAQDWAVGEIEAWGETAVERARLADLVVLPRPDQQADYRRLAENLVLSAGTPCLLIPPLAAEAHAFRRVILAWNGTREAKRAMVDALPFLKRAAAVAVLVVREDAKPWLGSAAQTEALTRHLARHGVQAEKLLPAQTGRSAGDALLEHCRAYGADLLVMGAFGHSRAAETILGGATRTILTSAEIPVLLSH
jgi:nucleotide-binding universal stress UspA family protein